MNGTMEPNRVVQGTTLVQINAGQRVTRVHDATLESRYRGTTEGGTPCTLVSPALLKRQWRFSVKIHTF